MIILEMEWIKTDSKCNYDTTNFTLSNVLNCFRDLSLAKEERHLHSTLNCNLSRDCSLKSKVIFSWQPEPHLFTLILTLGTNTFSDKMQADFLSVKSI